MGFKLAAAIDLKKSDKTTLVSQVRGILSIYGNKLELDVKKLLALKTFWNLTKFVVKFKEPSKGPEDKLPIPSPYGQLDVRGLMKELRKVYEQLFVQIKVFLLN